MSAFHDLAHATAQSPSAAWVFALFGNAGITVAIILFLALLCPPTKHPRP